MKRVLVTGGTGLIGRHVLTPLARRGFEIHVVSRKPPRSTHESVHWYAADLLDAGQTQPLLMQVMPTHLLHLAWYTAHGRFWDAAENLDWVAASVSLLRHFEAAGGQRAVLAGTCAEFDWSGDCCAEGTPLRPRSLYGKSKNALRTLLEAWAPGAGINAAWGRIFFTFGPGEHPDRVVPSVARALVAGEHVDCTSGDQVRDLLYVEDLAEAFAALVASDAEGTFDLGSGEPIRLGEVISRLGHLAGRSELIHFGRLPDRPEPARIVASPRRLRDEIGWSPRRDLDEGLRLTLDWWKRGGGVPSPSESSGR